MGALDLGSTLPSSSQGKILIAEECGEIVGVFSMETVIHIGPVWVKPRQRGVFRQLILAATEMFPSHLRGGVIVAANAKVVRLLSRIGLKKIPHPVFKVEV